jgi:hypothetical protein
MASRKRTSAVSQATTSTGARLGGISRISGPMKSAKASAMGAATCSAKSSALRKSGFALPARSP